MVAPVSEFGFPYTVDPGAIRGGTDQAPVNGSNNCHYVRVHDSGSISKIGLWVVTSSGNISVAVYRNTGKGRLATPGARIATSGAIACPAVGYQEISLGAAIRVRPGDWLALSADNVTCNFRSLLGIAADNNLGLGRQFRQPTAHPAPTTPSSLVATVGFTFVLVGVR